MFYQCKMCGGTLEINNNDSVGVCEYCGTRQTLPRLDNDKKANLYDRAAHFRQNNDYDAARVLYEQVLAEDKTDAEAYWSIVLCRYGIEYVEDPTTHKRIPTVNRTQYTSIFNDSDYKQAIQYADPFQSEIYEREAKAIDDIQKGILKISKNEEPFDIFICYKESDDNGRRTIDSVLAYDVYKELIGVGYKVFFSRITLEDKIGTAYEPYIFAALNSAPIMLVIGTKPEYFNAVWVKNEWSRFLGMIKSGAKKTLIPMYKDMSPYDLPQEFAHLQAQDMNNLGYMQDLLRGIGKIRDSLKGKTVQVISDNASNSDALMKRGLYELEDKEWENAKTFFNQVLNIDPENGDAYIGLLLAEMNICDFKELARSTRKFDHTNEYKKAVRFAEPEIAEQLKKYAKAVNDAFAERGKKDRYDNAKGRYEKAATADDYRSIALVFRELGGYLDSADLLKECEQKADEIINEKKRKAKKAKTTIIICSVILCAVLTVCGLIFRARRITENKYVTACTYMDDEKYDEAITAFTELGNYQDSAERIVECEKRKSFAPIKNAKVGDIIQYGNYNGNTDWVVLDKVENEKLLLIACNSVGDMPYNDENAEVTWETCSLRKWLNETYINEAFSQKEQERLLLTDMSIRDNRQWRITGDRVVQDKVILPVASDMPKLLELNVADNYDTMWLFSVNFPDYYAQCASRNAIKFSYIRPHVQSENDVVPEIWIDISGY